MEEERRRKRANLPEFDENANRWRWRFLSFTAKRFVRSTWTQKQSCRELRELSSGLLGSVIVQVFFGVIKFKWNCMNFDRSSIKEIKSMADLMERLLMFSRTARSNWSKVANWWIFLSVEESDCSGVDYNYKCDGPQRERTFRLNLRAQTFRWKFHRKEVECIQASSYIHGQFI